MTFQCFDQRAPQACAPLFWGDGERTKQGNGLEWLDADDAGNSGVIFCDQKLDGARWNVIHGEPCRYQHGADGVGVLGIGDANDGH